LFNFTPKGIKMPTRFTITESKRNPTSGGHYEMEREHKKEMRKIAELEKELKAHEKTDMAHAHPMRRSHEAQPQAGIPALRK
jgi:hypothetical protein